MLSYYTIFSQFEATHGELDPNISYRNGESEIMNSDNFFHHPNHRLRHGCVDVTLNQRHECFRSILITFF